MKSQKLTNLQQELLKIYSFELPEKDLSELKKVLSRFFAKNLRDRVDMIWDEKDYDQQTMDDWLNSPNQ